MTTAEFLRSQLDHEAARSRRVIEEAPEGRTAWKPHEKSMEFGYLMSIVATIPSWVTMMIDRDELDVAPAAGSEAPKPARSETRAQLLAALDEGLAGARAALARSDDAFLATEWRLLARGSVVQRASRGEMIAETLSHWSHHRGQATVYLRLLGAKVPGIFGPSADEKTFG